MSQSNKKKKRRGGARQHKQSPASTTTSSSASTFSHSDGGTGVAAGPPFERPETYTLIAKEVPSDMLPDLLNARPKMLGASAVRQRYLQGVPVSDVFIDLLHPPSRTSVGAESPMLVQLRAFFPVYPFNYCATCLGKYHVGACPAIPGDVLPPSLLPPTTAATTTTGAFGGDDDDDDELPPLLDNSDLSADEDEVDANADNDDDDDELPPLLDNSDLSADEESSSPQAPAEQQRSGKPSGQQSSSSARTARGSTPGGGSALNDGLPEGNYYDDYRYNPPLVYEQSISFVTGAVPPIRDFSRHRAAILTFLMSQNVDVAQITDVQPTTTGFKVFLASSIALRGFGQQTECVVPTLGKVKIEVFNGYRRDAKPGWHDTGSDEDFTDEEDYDEDGYYRQAPAPSPSRKAAKPKTKTKTKTKTKANAKTKGAAAVPAPAYDDDDMPALMDGSSSEDEDDMPALRDDSSDESDHDDYAPRRPQKPMKPPRAAIVSRIKEEMEQRKQLDEHLKQLEMTRNQVLKRQRRQGRRPEDHEAEAIRFADLLSGVERAKQWKCVRVDCKNPVIYHYEKRVKAKCEKGCIAQYHKSCWQDVAKQAPHGGHALCAQCGAHITWTSLRINFGERKKLYALGDESAVDQPANDTSATTATKNESEGGGDVGSEERRRDWLASAKRQEEELKRRRDEAERKRREQEELAKREEEERRQKRRQERKQRKRERDRKGEPQMGEMVVVARAGERAQPKPKPATTDESSPADAPAVDPTALLQAAPVKIHIKKAEKAELPESAKQDLERRRQRNAKKKQKKLEKRQAKNALRIDLASPSPTSTDAPVSLAAVADWPAEALRVAQLEGYQLPPPDRVVLPIVDPVTGAVINAAQATTATANSDEDDIWAVPAGDNGAAATTPAH